MRREGGRVNSGQCPRRAEMGENGNEKGRKRDGKRESTNMLEGKC